MYSETTPPPDSTPRLWRVVGTSVRGNLVVMKVRAENHAGAMARAKKLHVRVQSCVLLDENSPEELRKRAANMHQPGSSSFEGGEAWETYNDEQERGSW